MRRTFAGIASVATLVLASSAFAADLPVKAPPKAAVVQSSSGMYLWVDGSYEHVNLPTHDLGFKQYTTAGVGTVGAPFDSRDPRATGWGIAGAVGYVRPWGPGRTLRFEIGGSYVDADTSDSSAGSITGTGATGYVLQLLSGAVQTNQTCLVGTTCRSASSLNTDYRAWNIHGKVAVDYHFGATTLSPSLAVFGGQSRNDQSLVQSVTDTAFSATVPVATYSANTALRWTDVGVRGGLDVQHAVSRWLSLGVGGTLGVAHRDVDLSGSDLCQNGFAAICTAFTTNPPASTISTSATKTPFLATAEANVTVRPWASNNVALRGFVGLSYDSDVPGVATPGQPPSAVANNPTPTGAPASIKFDSELSWRAGGGLIAKF